MSQDNGPTEHWSRLIGEVISSWRTVFRAVVLVLACTPFAIVLAVLLVTFR